MATALWSDSGMFLPPPPNAQPLLSTEDYCSPTDIYLLGRSPRLLTVGHPYFAVGEGTSTAEAVPLVSGHQYRVFRVQLPDPNDALFLPDTSIHSPDHKLVYRLTGIEVKRGQPFGIGASGNPEMNLGRDVENTAAPPVEDGEEVKGEKVLVSNAFDPKQAQMFIVGCTPAVGQYWGPAKACSDTSHTNGTEGKCPRLQLYSEAIQDGDFFDMGLGAMDHGALTKDHKQLPLELWNRTTKYPDWIQMEGDPYGDSCFFLYKWEQLYGRHFHDTYGAVGEKYTPPSGSTSPTLKRDNYLYHVTPSGSLVTSDKQLFNKPYWLGSAMGHNQGILWGQQCFITVLDNTRAHNMLVSQASESSSSTYESSHLNNYLRHAEEFSITMVVQVCRIKLNSETLFHIQGMAPHIVDDWGFSPAPLPGPSTSGFHSQYRFSHNAATVCDKDQELAAAAPRDPYADMKFWDVRLELKPELHTASLGRKFMLLHHPKSSRGTKRPSAPPKAAPAARRRR
ncbi:L1 [Hemidactylus frenatus papillomavirus 2]|uniref:Major capsid protein L1 n=1 Tax=Hemidactylus frenatus papillomavirus 2 TaxID=2670336 RepID=A0A649Z0K0_9PAPI|nr:L1 [Hemidactylus frenatus papillomavirus 2]